jgi:hypothetical protein
MKCQQFYYKMFKNKECGIFHWPSFKKLYNHSPYLRRKIKKVGRVENMEKMVKANFWS